LCAGLLLASSAAPSVLAPFVFAPVALAQSAAPDTDPGAGQGAGPGASPSSAYTSRAGDIDAELAGWRAAHGPSWHVVHEPTTGYARFLFGGKAAAAAVPLSDADWYTHARSSFASARALLGIEDETLVPNSVMLLPLALAGSSNKMTVEFRQVVNGVPVRGGFANALYDVEGNLLSLDTTGLPDVAHLDVTPELPAERALASAAALFQRESGLAPTRVLVPELVVERESDGKLVRGTLAWNVSVYWDRDGYPTQGWGYRIAAQGEPRVISEGTLVHSDVGATVSTMATPGNAADTAGNPEVAELMRHARVTSSAGTVFTDANGNFNFAGVNTPLQVTITYVGTWNNVQNAAGAAYSLTTTLQPNQSNAVLLNPSGDALVTAQANAFQSVNELHDWTKAINPGDTLIDFVATADVNNAAWCNAWYIGDETQYFLPDGSCANTAFSSVVYHETGHWMNDRYGSGNGPDGFGEGNADNYSTFLSDNPIIGENFTCVGAGCYIRTAENTRQFCGDSSPGCYGQVHADGEVLMGAFWKFRKRLNLTHGNSVGDARANFLFNAWMNAYNDAQIKTIVETHLLVLDDNDGNIDNGTPNYADIDAGFKEQGFPGYTLALIQIAGLNQLADTKDEAGPYGLQVSASSLIGGSIANVVFKYSVDGGAYQNVAATAQGGNLYTALLPGIASPAKVRYYAQATDNVGNVALLPKDGAAAALGFAIGVEKVFFFDNLEQSGDNGWTHAQVSTQDDWQKGTPAGKSGTSQGVAWQDPTSAASGTRIWANDLGNTISGTTWNGRYGANVSNWLRSPVINCSQAAGSILAFKRWLSVENSTFDFARIKVNGQQVWVNPLGVNVQETQWNDFEVDISAQADGNPAVQLEWSLVTDGGLELGGWAIDDVTIKSFDPTPTACLPTSYGAGLAGTNGVPVLDSAGEALEVDNPAFRVKLKKARANSTAWFALGFAQTSVPIVGGTLLVVPTLIYVRTTDVFGQAEVALPLPADGSIAGLACSFQAVVADPAAAQGFAFTKGLTGSICP
jgi:hypothetical protein